MYGFLYGSRANTLGVALALAHNCGPVDDLLIFRCIICFPQVHGPDNPNHFDVATDYRVAFCSLHFGWAFWVSLLATPARYLV